MNKLYINYGIVIEKSKYRRRIGTRCSILIVSVFIIIVVISILFIVTVDVHIEHIDLYEDKEYSKGILIFKIKFFNKK